MVSNKTLELVVNKFIFLKKIYLPICSLILLALLSHFPAGLLPGATYDDQLGWLHGASILSGKWLGEYNQLTLAKGPGFSLFVAGNYLLGIPITLSMGFLLLFSAIYFRYCLYRIRVSPIIVELIFLTLIFDPAFLPARILRDYICAPLLILFIASLLDICFYSAPRIQKFRLWRPILSGLPLGFLGITREDTVWIFFGFILFILLLIFQNRRCRGYITSLLKYSSIYIVGSSFVIAGVMLMNYLIYGIFLVNDFQEPQFARALNAIYSVDSGPEVNKISVSKIKREAIYGVSNSFSELKGSLENPTNSWLGASCQLSATACGDFGSYWVWAFRDSVASKGYYVDAQKTSHFYKKIADQIEAACSIGKLHCIPNLVSLMPRLPNGYLRKIYLDIRPAFRVLLHSNSAISPPITDGSEADIDIAKRLLGNPLATYSANENTNRISGWYHDDAGGWISVSCNKGIVYNISRGIRPDLVSAFKDQKAINNGFSISAPLGQNCLIYVTKKKQAAVPFDVIVKKSGTGYSLGSGTLWVDSISYQSQYLRSQKAEFTLLGFLMKVYKIMYPIFFFLGIFSLVLGVMRSVIRKRRLESELQILCFCILALIILRIILLSLVDLTSFPAINGLYLISTIPLLPIFGLISFYSFVVIEFKNINKDNVERPR